MHDVANGIRRFQSWSILPTLERGFLFARVPGGRTQVTQMNENVSSWAEQMFQRTWTAATRFFRVVEVNCAC